MDGENDDDGGGPKKLNSPNVFAQPRPEPAASKAGLAAGSRFEQFFELEKGDETIVQRYQTGEETLMTAAIHGGYHTTSAMK